MMGFKGGNGPENVHLKVGTFLKIRAVAPKPCEKWAEKNPPALFVSGRGIGVLQVYFQVDVMPSTGLYHAISRFLERMGVLKVQRQLHEPDRITSGGS